MKLLIKAADSLHQISVSGLELVHHFYSILGVQKINANDCPHIAAAADAD